MTERRVVLCLCALCAFAFSAYGASAASAAIGTTAYTCKAGVSGFSTAHCVPGQTGTSFGHVAIPESTTTELSGTSDKTNSETTGSVPTKLRSTVAGVNTELEGKWDFEGEITGGFFGPIPYVHGTFRVKYTSAAVVKPAGKGCKVKGGEFTSNELVTTTLEQGMGLKIEPKAGTVLATFEIEGCSVTALNGVYELKGSLVGTPNGATVEFTHEGTTTQSTLTLRGQKAGLDGKITLSSRANSTESFTPLSFTTTEK